MVLEEHRSQGIEWQRQYFHWKLINSRFYVCSENGAKSCQTFGKSPKFERFYMKSVPLRNSETWWYQISDRSGNTAVLISSCLPAQSDHHHHPQVRSSAYTGKSTWHCSRICGRVYVTVRCSSVCLSIPSIDRYIRDDHRNGIPDGNGNPMGMGIKIQLGNRPTVRPSSVVLDYLSLVWTFSKQWRRIFIKFWKAFRLLVGSQATINRYWITGPKTGSLALLFREHSQNYWRCLSGAKRLSWLSSARI